MPADGGRLVDGACSPITSRRRNRIQAHPSPQARLVAAAHGLAGRARELASEEGARLRGEHNRFRSVSVATGIALFEVVEAWASAAGSSLPQLPFDPPPPTFPLQAMTRTLDGLLEESFGPDRGLSPRMRRLIDEIATARPGSASWARAATLLRRSSDLLASHVDRWSRGEEHAAPHGLLLTLNAAVLALGRDDDVPTVRGGMVTALRAPSGGSRRLRRRLRRSR